MKEQVQSDINVNKKKREGFDYRKRYIEHNPGYLGNVYICSQCGKFLTREEMEVDHIIPISSPYSVNKVINCVSICSPCNKKKSNKIGIFLVKSFLVKILEELYILLHHIIIFSVRSSFNLCMILYSLTIKTFSDSRSIILKIGLVLLGLVFLLIIGNS